jgi:hypothetical protein
MDQRRWIGDLGSGWQKTTKPIKGSCERTERQFSTRQALEHRAGIEPAYTGFADLRVSHFATGAWGVDFHPKLKTHSRKAGGSAESQILVENLALRTRPRGAAWTAAAETHRGGEPMSHQILCRRALTLRQRTSRSYP